MRNWVVRKLGLDPAQYFLLLGLFRTLSDRQEFALRSTQVSRYTVVVLFAIGSAILSLIDVSGSQPSLGAFVVVNVVLTGLLLLLILLPETLNTFLNPVETSVLAHHPIQQRTYFAAKFSYLLAVVASIVFPPNIVPAFAGWILRESRWFFPLTYLVSIFMLGIFISLSLCALIGLALRVFAAYRVRGIAMAIEVSLWVILVQFPRIERWLDSHGLNLPPWANPVNWFVSLAQVGQGASGLHYGWPGLLMIVLSVTLISLGVRSLSEGYLTRVHFLLKTGSRPRGSKREWLGPLLRWMTGRPSGRAAFSFIYCMAKTDWQFRISVLPVILQLLVTPAIGIVRGLGLSPFASGGVTAAYFLPHLGGMAGLPICVLLTHSDQYRGAWIFLTAPLDGIRSFVRGIFWALWVPFSAGSMLLLPLYIWYWGLRDAVLFAAYSLAVGSFYVSVELFLVDGLPFANPPKQSSFLAAPLAFAAFVAAGLIVVFEWWFIFQNRLATIGASLVFAGAAYFISRVSFLNLETNVQYNLHAIASGRTAMFQEIE